mgnify:FL=1
MSGCDRVQVKTVLRKLRLLYDRVTGRFRRNLDLETLGMVGDFYMVIMCLEAGELTIEQFESCLASQQYGEEFQKLIEEAETEEFWASVQ